MDKGTRGCWRRGGSARRATPLVAIDPAGRVIRVRGALMRKPGFRVAEARIVTGAGPAAPTLDVPKDATSGLLFVVGR